MVQPRARQMIYANGVQLEPTLQQTRLQLNKLIGDALKPDMNGDDTITAEEISRRPKSKPRQQAAAGNRAPGSSFR